MAYVEIDNNGKITCDLKECKPIELWQTGDECGNCPLILFARTWLDTCLNNR